MTDSFLPVVPDKSLRQLGSERRAVVYLDQGFVSALAAARLGERIDGERREALEALFDALIDTVRSGRAICVESWTHRQESTSLSNAKFREISETMTWLCRGLWFFETMLERQTQEAVQRRAGRPSLSSAALFNTGLACDPDAPKDDGDIVLGVQWGRVAPARSDFAALNVKARALGDISADYSTELERCRVALREQSLASNARSSWGSGYSSWPKENPGQDEIEAFIRSDDFFKVPYAMVSTEMFARVLSDARRASKDSDYLDIEALTRAIPYCDLVIHDRYMVGRAKLGKLDDIYNVKLLAASNEGLADAAEWLRALPQRVDARRRGSDGSQ